MKREEILQFIKENPNTTQKRIVYSLDCYHALLYYHLRVLINLGYITKTKKGRNMHYNLTKKGEQQL